LLEGVVLLQQRIKNEDMAAKWRGEEFTSLQRTEAERVAAEPIVVGGGPVE
jgi:NADH-quinone oxidoreductase subunit B